MFASSRFMNGLRLVVCAVTEHVQADVRADHGKVTDFVA